MLDLMLLDDLNYRKLLNGAVSELPELSSEWTNYNAHDPGITFLEYLVWLTEMQRYYCGQITKRHTMQFLKLLGASPLQATPAKLLATVETAEEGDIYISEGAEANIGGLNYMNTQAALLNGSEVLVCRDVTERSAEPYGFYPFGKLPSAGDCVYLHLSSGLLPQSTYRLYVHLAPREGVVPMEDGYCPQAVLTAEVWNGAGWQPCGLTDKTFGFAQSGFCTIQTPERCMFYKERFFLRLTLLQCDIEEAPMLLGLNFRTLEFIQQKPLYPENTVLSIQTGRTAGIDTDGLWVCGIEAEVLEEDEQYHTWTRTDNLYCSGSADRHFELDEDESCLRFGDGRYGKRAGNTVRIKSLFVTKGSGGRVKENLRFTIQDNTQRYTAENPFAATGGTDRESIEQACSRVAKITRLNAVTENDYKTLVANTPGLKIQGVSVFSRETGKVRVCVKTDSGRLTRSARENICRRLEAARLCGTEIEICEPQYWKARLNADIRLEQWAGGRADNLKERIKAFIMPLENQFGLTISLSAWRDIISEIALVSKVSSLTLLGQDGRLINMDASYTLPRDTLLSVTEYTLHIL